MTQTTKVSNAKIQANKTDTLGIVSIIMAFTALQIPGLIIGIVGEKNAKKENRPHILSRLGWILNLVLLFIALVSLVVFVVLIPSHRNKVDDLGRKADLRVFSQKLEEYHDKNGFYPSKLESSLVNGRHLSDSDGKPYIYKASPEGCTECKGYVLETTLERPENGNRIYQLVSKH